MGSREQYRREVERQNDRLERFASLVSHDLRNPLNVAQGRLELLEEEVKPENENAAAIDRALTRIEELLEEILEFARQGERVEHWDAVRISTIVSDCWAMVETGDGELVIADDITFEANPERVKRLFENLFRNAIEHGGTDVTVSIGIGGSSLFGRHLPAHQLAALRSPRSPGGDSWHGIQGCHRKTRSVIIHLHQKRL